MKFFARIPFFSVMKQVIAVSTLPATRNEQILGWIGVAFLILITVVLSNAPAYSSNIPLNPLLFILFALWVLMQLVYKGWLVAGRRFFLLAPVLSILCMVAVVIRVMWYLQMPDNATTEILAWDLMRVAATIFLGFIDCLAIGIAWKEMEKSGMNVLGQRSV